MPKIIVGRCPFIPFTFTLDVPKITPEILLNMMNNPEDIVLDDSCFTNRTYDPKVLADSFSKECDRFFSQPSFFRRKEHLRFLVEHMEREGLSESKSVGYFITKDSPEFGSGSILKIKKGVIIHSTSSQQTKINGVARKINVKSVIHGLVDNGRYHREVVDIKIQWAGSSGYWNWVSPNDISFD